MADALQFSVRAHEIALLLDSAPAGITTLSLDCFDTLLWRIGNAPRDVFAELTMAGGATEPRMWAESAARRVAHATKRSVEISIEDIYRHLLPNADAPEISEAVAVECALEARHCYAFEPVVNLMRLARLRGLNIIVVSDTYFSEPQLRALIGAAAGDGVLGMIDHIFTSSDQGTGKGENLFGHVLKTLGAKPEQLLHLGDNLRADQVRPSSMGIVTAHLKQFDEVAEHRLRLETAAAALIDPATRITTPAFQPQRPALSLRSETDPAFALGHDVLGPVLHSFAHWVKAEGAALSEKLGKPVRPLFLLRDGYLPRQTFDAVFGEGESAAIEISRFTAAAAGLTDAAALDAYLVDAMERNSLDVVARQLLLHGPEYSRLLKAKPGQDARALFRRAINEPSMARKILSRAATFADRLAAHLAAAGVAPGDAVMLVDLGYNGSVQNLVEPVLRSRMQLEVAGRYLLLRESQQSGLDKAGLLDTQHYDCKLLNAMCGSVAVLEQLCTIAQGSVVDYTASGDPVRKSADIKGAQSEIRERVQAGCVAFARDAAKGIHRPAAADTADARRFMAAASLARLLFLPIDAEVKLFEAFDHDVNLGTEETVKLLDVTESAAGLRRRGLSYLAETERMYVPGELAAHGLPLNLSLFSANRFGLDLRTSDFEVGGIEVPVILADAHGQTIVPFQAHPTSDGYYRLTIPVGTGQLTAAIQLGAIAAWVQVDEAHFTPVSQIAGNARGIAAVAMPDGMSAKAPNLYEAQPHGLLLVPPPTKVHVPMALTLIFRPVVWRDAVEAERVAA